MTVTDYGADLAGVSDLTPNLAESSGEVAVVERVARRWLEQEGALWIDPQSGANMMKALNAPVYPWRLGPRLSSEAVADEAVEECEAAVSSVEATRTIDVRAHLTLTDASELSFTLSYDGVTAKILLGT